METTRTTNNSDASEAHKTLQVVALDLNRCAVIIVFANVVNDIALPVARAASMGWNHELYHSEAEPCSAALNSGNSGAAK